MIFLKLIFWASLGLIFYNYFGYAIIALIFNSFKKKVSTSDSSSFNPGVSFIVAAYNEEDYIIPKIQNTLEQEYPSEKMEIIFITDGSNDSTPSIVQKYSPPVILMHESARMGKSAALNRAVKAATNDILIFSDCNTILNKNAIKNITRHYIDSKVGGVAGEKKIIDVTVNKNADRVTKGEGLYWKYESYLKKIDSEFYSVVGAAGELFSLRKNLYEPVDKSIILDDFILSLKAAEKGYRIIYEPDAYASELSSSSIKEEQKRKIRIAAGGFQSIQKLSSLLLFWRTPKLSFLYISHRVLRWAVSPFCLIIALLTNAILAIMTDTTVYKTALAAQVLFYTAAFLSPYIPARGVFKLLKVPYYFVFMNISVIQGFIRFLKGKQSGAWEKTKRLQLK